jgi:hypothetical protein
MPKITGRTAYALILVFAVLITALSQTVKYKRQIKEIQALHDEEMKLLRVELKSDYDSQMTELIKYYEYGGDVSQIELEAEYIAKVLYGYYTVANHAVSDFRAIVWCIINRVEHYSHPDTVAEVCDQPNQWMGYSVNNPVLQDLYDIALTELKIWHNGGHRPMNNSYVFLTWSSSEILLRDTFEEGRNTNYWRMR